ncbi:alkaline phosphatase family protein [Halobacterium sp. KA-6]|uniref:alkaline phosphatase family protein n=1 Tax=Halobacterium sp. KA-6 TaxID=2896368 RepID=UPI001E34299F|nr:alkaline phosphatase family protein [Halobacterium sp. KA-6]MCD2205026.1 alkaline phosphatase family protein [Halobacterium sp. KA-6]
MTIVVLALDALDAGLVDYFDLDALKLESHGGMDTFANAQKGPYTPEVWATVATGLSPDEHGVTGEGVSEWDNSLVDFASKFTGHLPTELRMKLGSIASKATGAEYSVAETSASSIFDGEGRVVHNWPGVANGEELASVWEVMFEKPEQSEAEFEREVYGIGAGQLAWAEEMLRHDVSLVGVHVHTPDAVGHAYAEDEEKFRECYEWTAGWVDRICDALGPDDDLVLLSDHGIVTSFYSGEEDRNQSPGAHSWRAYAASTFDSVPSDVFDVKGWLEPKIGDHASSSEAIDMPEEQLRQLGYIE